MTSNGDFEFKTSQEFLIEVTLKMKIAATDRQKISEIVRRIKPAFKKTGEERLCFEVIHMAIRDAAYITETRTSLIERRAAKLYLAGRMYHAEICGIDPDWIRRVIKNVGLSAACGVE